MEGTAEVSCRGRVDELAAEVLHGLSETAPADGAAAAADAESAAAARGEEFDALARRTAEPAGPGTRRTAHHPPAREPRLPAEPGRAAGLPAPRRVRRRHRTRIIHHLIQAGDTPGTPCRDPDPALALALTVTEIATTLTVPERTAGALTADAARLARFPDTLHALETGTITWTKATTITDAAEGLPDPALPEFEAGLLTAAPALTRPQLAARARRLRDRIHPEALAARRARAEQDRRVCFEPADDAMAGLSAYLPAETALAAYNRIKTDATAAKHPAQTRTLTQLEADRFATLLLHDTTDTAPHPTGPNTGPAGTPDTGTAITGTPDTGTAITGTPGAEPIPRILPRALVSVTVPVLALLGRDIPADLDGYGPIPAETARQLTPAAPSLYRLLTHPETGAVLSVGRTAYKTPAPLRRYLAHRDHTCRFPGCNRQARFCHIDHTKNWQSLGTTNHTNLAHLCPKHHAYKTRHRWKARQLDNATLEWTSPTGRKHTTNPRE